MPHQRLAVQLGHRGRHLCHGLTAEGPRGVCCETAGSKHMIAFFKSLLQLSPTREVQVYGDTHCEVYGIEYRPLYQCLLRLPGVVLPRKPHYLWTGLGVYAEFVLGGHTFQIEGDPWDGGLCISPQDGLSHKEEVYAIREHLKRCGFRS